MDTEIEHSSKMTECECKFLNDVSLKLKSKIHDLVQNEIAKNLRLLKDDVSQKLDKLSAYTNESVNQLCNYRLQERDNLDKIVAEIRESVQAVRKGDDEIMEKQERFKKVRSRLTQSF